MKRAKGFDFEKAQALKEKRDRLREERFRLVRIGRGHEFLPNVNAESTECEYQFKVASVLSEVGYKCRLELSSKCKTSRFDILVYWDKTPITIIELKKHTPKQAASRGCMDKRTINRLHSIQQGRYEDYGVPVLLLRGAHEIETFVSDMRTNPQRLVQAYNESVQESRRV